MQATAPRIREHRNPTHRWVIDTLIDGEYVYLGSRPTEDEAAHLQNDFHRVFHNLGMIDTAAPRSKFFPNTDEVYAVQFAELVATD